MIPSSYHVIILNLYKRRYLVFYQRHRENVAPLLLYENFFLIASLSLCLILSRICYSTIILRPSHLDTKQHPLNNSQRCDGNNLLQVPHSLTVFAEIWSCFFSMRVTLLNQNFNVGPLSLAISLRSTFLITANDVGNSSQVYHYLAAVQTLMMLMRTMMYLHEEQHWLCGCGVSNVAQVLPLREMTRSLCNLAERNYERGTSFIFGTTAKGDYPTKRMERTTRAKLQIAVPTVSFIILLPIHYINLVCRKG